jgi:hypothetical protein
MKRKLLTSIFICIGTFSFAQFTTGTVDLIGANRTLKIDTDATTVTLTLTGPSTAWLGVGFGGTSMSSVSDMFIWNGTANRDYTASGSRSQPSADAAASQSWTIVSDVVVGSTRTVIATRALVSAGDYTFLNNSSTIPVIFAEGASTSLGSGSHNTRGSRGLTRTTLGLENFSLQAASVFPNPSNGSFKIKTKTGLNKINIFSQIGAFVRTIEVTDNSDNVEVQVEGLQTGVYLMELTNKSEKSWKKVIVN